MEMPTLNTQEDITLQPGQQFSRFIEINPLIDFETLSDLVEYTGGAVVQYALYDTHFDEHFYPAGTMIRQNNMIVGGFPVGSANPATAWPVTFLVGIWEEALELPAWARPGPLLTADVIPMRRVRHNLHLLRLARRLGTHFPNWAVNAVWEMSNVSATLAGLEFLYDVTNGAATGLANAALAIQAPPTATTTNATITPSVGHSAQRRSTVTARDIIQNSSDDTTSPSIAASSDGDAESNNETSPEFSIIFTCPWTNHDE